MPNMTGPSHRKCLRRKHHQWEVKALTWSGWTIFRCQSCGQEEI